MRQKDEKNVPKLSRTFLELTQRRLEFLKCGFFGILFNLQRSFFLVSAIKKSRCFVHFWILYFPASTVLSRSTTNTTQQNFSTFFQIY
jgi:hypothetical protein